MRSLIVLRPLLLALAAITILLPRSASAEASAEPDPGLKVAVGLKVTTVGVGVEAALKINDYFSVRGGPNWIGFGLSKKSIDGIEYDLDLDFLNGSVFADVHPFQNGFRVTTGLFFGGNSVDLSSTPTEPVKVGDITFTPQELGTLDGDVSLNTVAPYVGFGWITGQDKEEGFQFFVDAGVKFGGHPDVNLTATGGTLSGLPILTNELAKEQGNIANDLKILGFYPLIQIGVNYRF